MIEDAWLGFVLSFQTFQPPDMRTSDMTRLRNLLQTFTARQICRAGLVPWPTEIVKSMPSVHFPSRIVEIIEIVEIVDRCWQMLGESKGFKP